MLKLIINWDLISGETFENYFFVINNYEKEDVNANIFD